MRGVFQQSESVRSTSSTLELFSAATLQVALFGILILIISSVGCLFIVWNKAMCNAYMYMYMLVILLMCLHVGDNLSLMQVHIYTQ